jgi:secreted trypsin-like serine protease
MRVCKSIAVRTAYVLFAGVVAVTSGQNHSEMSILPAPAPVGELRSIPRNTSAAEPQKYTNRIVGGTISAGRPFMAALLYQKDKKLYQYCAGSVIADRWLLTAAHCEVKVGEWAIVNRSVLQAPGGMKLRVAHVYNHEHYSPRTHDNDIALLNLSGDISSAIPRVTIGAAPPAGVKALAAGWGLTSEKGKQSLELREVEVPIVRDTVCKTKYPDLTSNMICAGEAGKDSCQGDSGGPLFVMTNGAADEIGIVSRGVGCGREGWPGIYTKVENYGGWIADTMKQLQANKDDHER